MQSHNLYTDDLAGGTNEVSFLKVEERKEKEKSHLKEYQIV